MNQSKHKGFTLVELLTVCAAVAILAGVAYPSYQESMRRARRADAKDALLGAQLAQEKFRANCPQYATAMSTGEADDQYTCPTNKMRYPAVSTDGYYSIAITAGTATTYNLTATPQGIQVGDGCGTFAVDQDGQNNNTGFADAECWER